MKALDALRERLRQGGLWATLWQFIKFSAVGVSNTLISLAVYWLCFYGLHWHYQLSNLVAFVISVTNAYYWNQRFVFAKEGRRDFRAHARAYGKAFLSYGATYLVGVALLALWVEVLGVDEGIAPLLNLIITVPANYLLNRFWAFR